MGFSPAAYDAVITKIQNGIQQIANDVNHFISEVESDTGWIPVLGGWIKDALNRLVKLIDDGLDKLSQLLEPAFIPTFFWTFGGMWEQMGGQAGTVSSTIAGQIQANGDEWQGIAGGAYANGVPAQGNAANTISSLAGQVQSACSSISTSGYIFYMAVAVAVASLIAAVVGAGTGALPVVIGAAVVFIASIATAVGSLLLGVDSAARNLQGMIGPSGSFPNGAWPIATAQ
jgi:hypothetical protein